LFPVIGIIPLAGNSCLISARLIDALCYRYLDPPDKQKIFAGRTLDVPLRNNGVYDACL
jgi:hypothetical protein